MDNVKDDAYYTDQIIKSLSYIMNKTKGWTIERFYQEEDIQYAILFHLIQICESARKLSNDFKKKSNIPWAGIIAMRDRIVCDSDRVDLEFIFDTVTEDVPDILEVLTKLQD